MRAEPLEFDLWKQLRLAQQMPEAIDVAQLLDAVEATVAQLPEAQQLQVAGRCCWEWQNCVLREQIC